MRSTGRPCRRILTEPKNSLIRQYTKLFELDNIRLSFDDEALEYIVDKSVEFKLGARGLRSILEAVMNDAMFEMPSKASARSLKVTKQFVSDHFNKSSMAKLRVA